MNIYDFEDEDEFAIEVFEKLLEDVDDGDFEIQDWILELILTDIDFNDKGKAIQAIHQELVNYVLENEDTTLLANCNGNYDYEQIIDVKNIILNFVNISTIENVIIFIVKNTQYKFEKKNQGLYSVFYKNKNTQKWIYDTDIDIDIDVDDDDIDPKDLFEMYEKS